jgi:hypothetical protein
MSNTETITPVWITAQEAAEWIGCSRFQLSRLVTKKRITYRGVTYPSHRRYLRSDVERIASQPVLEAAAAS